MGTRNKPFLKLQLTDKSIFMLHPNDEKPLVRTPGDSKCQLQHGNVHVKMSIALVYRNVTKTLIYDSKNSRRVLSDQYCNKHSLFLKECDQIYRENTEQILVFESLFLQEASRKMSQWKWL